MMHPSTKRLAWGALLTGVALGGFFDGILLHQILQWHHLLSGITGSETAVDLRFQVLADGLFHLMHYVVALIGVVLIWRGRDALRWPRTGRRLTGWALAGFGAWHVFDAVVSHWLLQIHRIRMDVDNPLVWDLLWVVPFGVGALAAGIWLLRRPAHGAPPGNGGGPRVALSLALGVLLAGPVAAIPPANPLNDGMSLVVFRPGATFADVVAAADAVDGRLVWTDESHGVWLIALGPDARASGLYRHGALMVSNAALGVGCLSWTTT